MEPSVVSEALEYGTVNEPVARVCYILQVRRKHPNSSIAETGLWASLEYPQLGCSPDGIVDDPVRPRRLLEVKCPYTLRDHDPNSFETVLTKDQLYRFYLARDSSGNLYLKKKSRLLLSSSDVPRNS